MIISRKKYLVDNVVFVDGLPGCGKTLFSKIIAAMDKVELLTYAYEIEYYCSLYFLEKITMDAAQSQISLTADLRLYDTMMGRNVNFRPTDLSSATQHHDYKRYFNRLFQAGDDAIPDVIAKERPILNLTTHHLLAHSEPIWKAFGNRCTFVEVVRHPLYMLRQQRLNEQNLFDSVKNFDILFLYDGNETPYYTKGWEEQYLKSIPAERAIYFIEHLTKRTIDMKRLMMDKYGAKIITIPFEKFVLSPDKYMSQIAEMLGSRVTDSTRNVMNEQKVPRSKISDGIDIPTYRRYGWTPPIDGASEREELLFRRAEMESEVSNNAMDVLDKLISEYEKEYWTPEAN